MSQFQEKLVTGISTDAEMERKMTEMLASYDRSEVTNFIFTMGLKMIIEIYHITRNCSYSYILLLPMPNHDFNSLHQIDKKCF